MHWGVFLYFYIDLFVIFRLTRNILVIFHWPFFFFWKGVGAYVYALARWWCSCSLGDACDATCCSNLVFHRVPRSATTSSFSWWSVWQWLMSGLSSVGVFFFFFLLFSLSQSKYMFVLFFFQFQSLCFGWLNFILDPFTNFFFMISIQFLNYNFSYIFFLIWSLFFWFLILIIDSFVRVLLVFNFVFQSTFMFFFLIFPSFFWFLFPFIEVFFSSI